MPLKEEGLKGLAAEETQGSGAVVGAEGPRTSGGG